MSTILGDLMRALRLSKPHPEPISEAEAYERSYGERRDVRRVKLPPRRGRHETTVSGEELRRRFEERLSARHEDDA